LCCESGQQEIQVRLADVLVGLERAEFALRQLRTNFANGFPFRRNLRELHQQTIGELVAGGQPGWTSKDLLRLEREDAASRLAVLQSSHERQNDLAAIDLRHFWMEMN